jgi:uncharacterized membrane protein YcfT
MISGLFLANVIDRDWRIYLDRKVVHFFYFYLLWTAIQFAFKAPGIAAEGGIAQVIHMYLVSFIDPFGTLWFIYLLPIFFVFIKLTKRVPWPVLWLIGAAMEISHVETGWMIPEEFAARFVYVYTYIAADFGFADRPGRSRCLSASGGRLQRLAVKAGSAPAVLSFSDWSAHRGRDDLRTAGQHDVPLRYCGRNSIVIYLAFFLPMARRALLLKTGIITISAPFRCVR